MLGTMVPVAITLGSGAAGNGLGALAGVLLMIPGPSLGYFYGGRPLRGLASTGVRAAALIGLPAAIAICWDNCGGQRGAFAGALAFAGMGLFIGSMIHDVTHVAEDLRREPAGERGTQIVPILDPIDRRAGLAVSLPF